MFFIFGISNSYDELNYKYTFTCECCNHLEQMSFYMFYSYFSLFFVKIFKWNKKYVGVCRNCNVEYEFTKESFDEFSRTGRLSEDMYSMRNCNEKYSTKDLLCNHCGFSTKEDFEYCPKCGNRL